MRNCALSSCEQLVPHYRAIEPLGHYAHAHTPVVRWSTLVQFHVASFLYYPTGGVSSEGQSCACTTTVHILSRGPNDVWNLQIQQVWASPAHGLCMALVIIHCDCLFWSVRATSDAGNHCGYSTLTHPACITQVHLCIKYYPDAAIPLYTQAVTA